MNLRRVCIKQWKLTGSFLFLITDTEDKYPSNLDFSKFYFPVAQADITECSTYTVVCRLKSSPSYTITSYGGSFDHPDYPGVSVTIPENAVGSETELSIRLKVGTTVWPSFC